jgi:hypothetical protein
VEAQVKALQATVDENIPVNSCPCDVSKQIQSLKLEKACDSDRISNEYLRHLPRKPLVCLTYFFNHSLSWSLPGTLERNKIITLSKAVKD